MADPVTRPDVILDLDRPRRLHFDMNTGAELEERSGRTIGDLLGSLSLSSMRWLVWGLLLHEEPGLTPIRVGVLLQTYWFERGLRLRELADPVGRAITQSWVYGPPKEDDEGNAPAEAAIGSASATG